MRKSTKEAKQQKPTPAKPKESRLQRYDKPLLPLISRRGFIAAGILSAASVTIRPWQNALAYPDPGAPKFGWNTFLKGVKLAAAIMGYGPVFMMVEEFIESIKSKDPERAAAVATDLAALRPLKIKPPTARADLPEYELYQAGKRLSIPLLHEDGLNGLRSYFIGKENVAHLSAPIETVVPGLRDVLFRLGFFQTEQSKLGALIRPVQQTKTYLSLLQESDKAGEDNRYKSALAVLLRYQYENLTARSGVNHVVVENIEDPVTGKPRIYEIPVNILIEG